MEPSTHKLIHTFGALADLGQEIAGTGDFTEMVRTSMHLLLGTLALRRGAVVECNGPGPRRNRAGVSDGRARGSVWFDTARRQSERRRVFQRRLRDDSRDGPAHRR